MSFLQTLAVSRTNSLFIQFVRYGLVGGVAFIADFGTLWAVTELARVHYLVGAFIGFCIGLALNYWLSSIWVFRSRKIADKTGAFFVFALIGVVGVAINEGVMWLSTERLGVHYLGSKVAAAAIVLIWNFFVRRALVFS